MRKVLYLALFPFFLSCSITHLERKITNDFIREKFEKSTYKPSQFKNNRLIEEAGDGSVALLFYEQIFNDTTQLHYNEQYWPLSNNQIQVLRNRKLKKHLWRKSDLSVYDFTIVSSKENSANFKSEYYLNLSDEFLVFTLSKPLLINDHEALCFYQVRHKLGGTIEQCVVLLKKENDVWKIHSSYHNANITW